MAEKPESPVLTDGSEVGLPPATPPKTIGAPEDQTLVNALTTYRLEAENNRRGGPNGRDDKWTENLDLYWNRVDFSHKAGWQAKEVMPEVAAYVDRFSAALKEALLSTPEGFYTVHDPADQEDDVTPAIKRMLDVWLSRSGRNQMGQLLPFSAVFEEQMKLGAMMACASLVTWKEDVPGGRVAIETQDPRNVWLDHTYRNLYRVRKVELDRHTLADMTLMKDAKGKPIWNLPEIERLIGSLQENQSDKEALSGHGQQASSGRSPIVLHEYIATVVDAQGEKIADRSLIVTANDQYLIRGPEANPFWHGQDWLVYAPLVTTPLSVYGRSYMEDFGRVAKTFTELTNMLLDAVHTSSLKAFAIVPSMLMNPAQAAEGLSPNKMFLLEDGYRAKDFAEALDLGTLPPESLKMWEILKSELTEGAHMNEVGLGQFAPNARTSATEIMETKSSSSALIRSVAQTVESRVLEPILDLSWKTGLQHVRASDRVLAAAAGPEMFKALLSQRRDLVSRPITFQARGISMVIQKAQVMKALVGILQIVGSNPNLAQKFFAVVDMDKLVKKLFELSGIDLSHFQLSERDKLIRSVTEPLQAAGAGGPGGGSSPPDSPGGAQMQGLSRSMGVGRG